MNRIDEEESRVWRFENAAQLELVLPLRMKEQSFKICVVVVIIIHVGWTHSSGAVVEMQR